MSVYNLISLTGVFGFVFIAWIFSRQRGNINFRVVFWGLMLQFLMAGFVFYVPLGAVIFNFLNHAVIKVLSFANSGIYFVFGPLALPPGSAGPSGEQSFGFILAFQALPIVIFFSALMSLLYHIGFMQKAIRLFSVVFTRFMKISGAESLCVSSNVVVGIESALTVRPYLQDMTRSELCTILTAGMATIASTVMAVYVGFLHKDFPAIAGHLISASLLSAPAAVVASKIIYPEDSTPLTLGRVVDGHYKRSSGWIEAVISGSSDGVRLCVGIIALLLSFLGLLAMFNWFIFMLGNSIGKLFGVMPDLSLQKILALVYHPLAFMMGVPSNDIGSVSTLLGERTIVTELVAYQHLAQYVSQGVLKDPRSIIITSYALCGFSHIASLAIFVGGITALIPQRSKDMAGLGFRALLASTLACLMTASVAGVFLTSGSLKLISF